MSSSFNKNLTSSSGSLFSEGFPSRSVFPLASTTSINASACLKSSKNLLPIPFPLCASGTSPATSITSTGMYRIPEKHFELFGLHFKFKVSHGHGFVTKEVPMFGFIVVNG